MDPNVFTRSEARTAAPGSGAIDCPACTANPATSWTSPRPAGGLPPALNSSDDEFYAR
jgi:hypothetical protein